MTEAEEREYLEYLRLKRARAAAPAPATAAPAPQSGDTPGAAETLLRSTTSALPLGRPIANAASAGALQLAKLPGLAGLLGVAPSARLTPEAQAQARELGLPYSEESAIPGVVETYRQVRDDEAAKDAAGRAANPGSALAGTGAGMALGLLAPLPKVKVGTGATVGSRLGSNAATGAAYGAANSATAAGGADLTKGELGQWLKEVSGVQGLENAKANWDKGEKWKAALDVMGAGALGGGALGAGLGSLVEGARPFAGRLEEVASSKALQSLGALKPELNKLGTAMAQRLGKFALDSGVVTPFASRRTMAERIASMKKAAGAKLGRALDEVDADLLPQERLTSAQAAQRVDEVARELAETPALRGVAERFQGEASKLRAGAAAGEAPGGMSLRQFEEVVARPYKQTTNWNQNINPKQKELQRLPRALEEEVERVAGAVAERTGNARPLRDYRAAKEDYGRLAKLGKVADEGVKRQAANNTWGLRDVIAAGAGATAGGPVGGLGMLLAGKAVGRFGDQWSATGARALANALAAPGGGAAGARGALLGQVLGPRPALRPALAGGLTEKEKRLLEAYAKALEQQKDGDK